MAFTISNVIALILTKVPASVSNGCAFAPENSCIVYARERLIKTIILIYLIKLIYFIFHKTMFSYVLLCISYNKEMAVGRCVGGDGMSDM